MWRVKEDECECGKAQTQMQSQLGHKCKGLLTKLKVKTGECTEWYPSSKEKWKHGEMWLDLR